MPQRKPQCTFYGVMPDMKPYLRSRLRHYRLVFHDERLNKDNIDPNTVVLGVFVDSKVTKRELDQMKKLKCIVTMSTGYDHISLSAARKRKIPVCNVPSYGEDTVAQHAMALILGISRKIFPSVKRVKEGQYDSKGLRGFDLKGKTVGVIGTGHIGVHLIAMLQGFGCRILCFDVHKQQDLIDRYGVTYVSKAALFKQSDIISLHVPLLPATEHLIDTKALKEMKDGVVIINTARGELIDSKALLEGLESDKIGAAGLDVLEDEGMVQHWEKLLSQECSQTDMRTSLWNNMIIDHPHTIVTPHNAFNSTEAVKRIMHTTAENVKAFFADAPTNDVSKQ